MVISAGPADLCPSVYPHRVRVPLNKYLYACLNTTELNYVR